MCCKFYRSPSPLLLVQATLEVHAHGPAGWTVAHSGAAFEEANRQHALFPHHSIASLSGTLPAHVCYFGDHIINDVVSPTSAGWHAVAVMPELETLAATAGSPVGSRRGSSNTTRTVNTFAASLADFNTPDATLDGRYELRSIGHGHLCDQPSGPAAQALRTAVLAVPSIEWLAEAMLPGLAHAAAAADAAGLRSLPTAPLVCDDGAASSGNSQRSLRRPPSMLSASVGSASGEGSPALKPTVTQRTAREAPLTSRFITALGSFLGGSGMKQVDASTALASCERAVSISPADIATAYGLPPVLQVRIFRA